ncbi:hypothetical protein [Streptomyces griseocarneus]|uniref:hypothetical protein n=1 Tax=Streptomyces griseocarneus TaxID=51201 RepID=UPI00167EE99C|nr:hypothetical protein [Streptomyces griseocarneus]MBZ6472577.1 hypothetical protein [Streptomyces griseocarneus]GHG46047.1 hypothetical protein GCM10018779_02350 [Streptomyces griseocarneus]
MRLKPVIAAPVVPALLGAVTLAALGGTTGCAKPGGHSRTGTDGSSRHTATPAPAGSVDLAAWITSFTDRITQAGQYRIPAAGDRRAIADGVRLLLDGDHAAAERSLARAGYTVRTLVDRDGGREFAEIADATKDGETTRGWGRVYVDLHGPAHWSVQVPHPSADQRTEQLGIGLLRSSPGGVLILAGAHRAAGAGTDGGEGEEGSGPADVAHRSDSVFAAVADALADRRLPAVQVHGFADSSLPDHDVVVSPGKGDAGLPAARRLASGLRKQQLRVCEVWQRYCGRLEGRTNVEGDHADAVGVPFLHVEHSRRLRLSDDLVAKAVRALAEVTRRWSAGRA